MDQHYFDHHDDALIGSEHSDFLHFEDYNYHSFNMEDSHQSFDPLHDDPNNHDLVHQDTSHTLQVLDAVVYQIEVFADGLLGDTKLESIIESHYPHFDSSYNGPGIIGDPTSDGTLWHEQQQDNTCAVVAQGFVLNSFGIHYSENELQHEAQVYGWYIPHGGTPLNHVGDLISYYGIPTEHHEGATINELANALSHGQKVIVGINAQDIWYSGTPNDLLTSYPGIPGQQADHTVEIIGIDVRDPSQPLVILNDPGISDGKGIEVPVAVFDNAWAASEHFMMSTTNATTSTTTFAEHGSSSAPLLGDDQSDADQNAWNAKQAEWKASWADWDAKQEAWKARWA